MSGPDNGPIKTVTSSMTADEAMLAYAMTVKASALPDEQTSEPNGHDQAEAES
jgi:hypothetical protein